MHKKGLYLALVLIFASALGLNAQNAKWITADDQSCNNPNTWIEFRQEFTLREVRQNTQAKISADSKYWLWINGEMAVFEGNLKRGPNHDDSYFDIVDLFPYLKKGKNEIKVLLCYFGKGGMSHVDSGRSGFIFDAESIGLVSDRTWKSRRLSSYQTSDGPEPNYRLSESNIKFDARIAGKDKWKSSIELGEWGDAPWNNLVQRPIPLWKDYGIKYLDYEESTDEEGNIILTARLPYNAQFTPVIELTDKNEGTLVRIETDHSQLSFDTQCLYAEYVTKNGRQSYESLGWINGHKLFIKYPADANIEFHLIGYRETGYDCEFEGKFHSSDNMLNIYRDKAVRTLYVNMRDNYFDCPDRERAQWWGDVTHLIGQSFYQLSPDANALVRKAIMELVDWQLEDGTLYAPVPDGIGSGELPAQILAAVGPYGFWHYYMHTGDKNTIEHVYPAVKRYLDLWSLDESGLTAFRQGGWSWGDWGENIDIRMLLAAWHYLALDAAIDMAEVTGNHDDCAEYEDMRKSIHKAFNTYWNGYAYRHPSYHGDTDDRVNALAIVSGLAEESKYEALLDLFKTQEFASPYMEKYVLEALVRSGYGDYALDRFHKRFQMMTEDPEHSTLHEGWDPNVMGGGSFNHAWSGGMLNVTAEWICGVRPVVPGWSEFEICPCPVLEECSIEIPTVKGLVKSSYTDDSESFKLEFTVPEGTKAKVTLPEQDYASISLNGKAYESSQLFEPGTYKIICIKK